MSGRPDPIHVYTNIRSVHDLRVAIAEAEGEEGE